MHCFNEPLAITLMEMLLAISSMLYLSINQYVARPTMSGDNYADPGFNLKLILSSLLPFRLIDDQGPRRSWTSSLPGLPMPHMTTEIDFLELAYILLFIKVILIMSVNVPFKGIITL